MGEFCCLGETVGARGGVIDSVTTRITSGWSKFRKLVSLLASCITIDGSW